MAVKVAILAGGFGTRLSEETDLKPKPMVEIGGRPILWHIMKHFAAYGMTDFHIALGYKGELVKRYFIDHVMLRGNLTVDLATGRIHQQGEEREDWAVHLIETGIDAYTGARIKRLEPQLTGDTFMCTYGDGVANVNLEDLLQFHRAHGRIATVTAVRPPARFGGLEFDGDLVEDFVEKPQIGEGWINGGFFVFEPEIFSYIDECDHASLEVTTLSRLARERQLVAYRHHGFWQCMDTLRDKRLLDSLWERGEAPWKVWA